METLTDSDMSCLTSRYLTATALCHVKAGTQPPAVARPPENKWRTAREPRESYDAVPRPPRSVVRSVVCADMTATAEASFLSGQVAVGSAGYGCVVNADDRRARVHLMAVAYLIQRGNMQSILFCT